MVGLTAANASTAEAAVACWILGQVLLVIFFGIEKLRSGHNLRGDRTKTKISQLLLHRLG